MSPMDIINSVSGYYYLLRPNTSEIISTYEHKIADLALAHPDIYQNLLRNGGIVPESLDEFQMVETIKFERRFSSQQYEIIVNPTMDCNLGCWYCYENHLPGSEIDDRTVRNIISISMSNMLKIYLRRLSSDFSIENLCWGKRVL